MAARAVFRRFPTRTLHTFTKSGGLQSVDSVAIARTNNSSHVRTISNSHKSRISRNFQLRPVRAAESTAVRVQERANTHLEVSNCRGYCTNTTTTCWKCGSATTDLHFCEKCGTIQPVREGVNYFEVLGFPTQFNINTKQLTQNFRQLQRRLHPDRFTQKSQEEQACSEDQSSLVNKSYQTLLKPLPRGLYLLDLHGASLEEGEIHLDPIFLMEIMEINEELAETRDIEVVRRIGSVNTQVLQDLIGVAAEAFAKGDIDNAKRTLARLKYYANIDDKVSEIEMKHAGIL